MIMKSFCLYCVINFFLCFHETVRNFDHHHMMQASLSLQKKFFDGWDYVLLGNQFYV